MSFLEVRHVQKIYTTRFGGTKVQALTDVNFTVEHANEMETILLLRSFQNSTRMYKSEVAKRVFAKEQAGCEFKDVAEDMAGKTACKMFFENADVENCGVICCGQTSGLIHDVLPVQTIIGQMMHECEATIAKFA